MPSMVALTFSIISLARLTIPFSVVPQRTTKKVRSTFLVKIKASVTAIIGGVSKSI